MMFFHAELQIFFSSVFSGVLLMRASEYKMALFENKIGLLIC